MVHLATVAAPLATPGAILSIARIWALPRFYRHSLEDKKLPEKLRRYVPTKGNKQKKGKREQIDIERKEKKVRKETKREKTREKREKERKREKRKERLKKREKKKTKREDKKREKRQKERKRNRQTDRLGPRGDPNRGGSPKMLYKNSD